MSAAFVLLEYRSVRILTFCPSLKISKSFSFITMLRVVEYSLELGARQFLTATAMIDLLFDGTFGNGTFTPGHITMCVMATVASRSFFPRAVTAICSAVGNL